jgi:hypothetical protein
VNDICPKCNGKSTKTRYCTGQDKGCPIRKYEIVHKSGIFGNPTYIPARLSEHLDVSCKVCGFTWTRPCADKTGY